MHDTTQLFKAIEEVYGRVNAIARKLSSKEQSQWMKIHTATYGAAFARLTIDHLNKREIFSLHELNAKLAMTIADEAANQWVKLEHKRLAALNEEEMREGGEGEDLTTPHAERTNKT